MLYLFGILIIIVSVSLVFVVVIQNSKGGGINSQFGGTATQVLGARRSNEFIETLTWSFAAAIVVLSFAANVSGTSGKSIDTVRIERSLQGQAAENPTSAPAADAFEQADTAAKK